MRKYRNGLILVAVCICLLYGIYPKQVVAATATPMIRVGLTGNCKDKSSITINNAMLTCGYWSMEKGEFMGCEVFRSKNGFSFAPFTTTCYVSEKSYSSFDKAEEVAIQFRSAGLQAYATILHDHFWKIYVAGDGNACAKAAEMGEGSFWGSTVTMRYRILVSGDFGAFMIDVDDSRNYPMFGATATNAKGDYILSVDGKDYRGYIEIGRYGSSGVTAINILPLEEYLYGVVPSEVSYTWPAEMLKAQAVVARSYAVAQDTIGPQAHVSSGGYKLEDTVVSQAYDGYRAEHSTTTNAVNATKGEMLFYRDNVIKAYYFSTSGGSTEDAQAVWNVPIPYFRQVSDITELEPAMNPWIVEMNSTQINKRLALYGYPNLGAIRRVTSEITTESGRVYALYLKGNSSVRLEKTMISSVLDLPSTKFKVITLGDVPDRVSVISADRNTTMQISNAYVLSGNSVSAKKAATMEQYVVMGASNLQNYPRKTPTSQGTFYFAGMGYGHGIGMSQSGAMSLAKEGYDYKAILNHYYIGIEIR